MARLRKTMYFALAVIFSFSNTTVPLISSSTDESMGDAAVRSLKLFELQLGSAESAGSEFITLYNPSDYELDASLIDVQYRSSNGSNWTSLVSSTQTEQYVPRIQPRGFYSFATDAYGQEHPEVIYHARMNSGLADSGGHVRVVVADDAVSANNLEQIDLLGWGVATGALGEPVPAPSRGMSVQRLFDQSGYVVDTGQNMNDFWIVENSVLRASFPVEESMPLEDEPPEDSQHDGTDQEGVDNDTPAEVDSEEAAGEGQVSEAVDEDEQVGEQDESSVDDNSITACSDAVVISEVLPNPQGPRSEFPRDEHAFIELHNTSNDSVSLTGCGLQEGSSSEVYWFSDSDSLPAQSYSAFYEKETGIQLPVSPSGTVYLLSTGDIEAQTVTYPASTPEAASWSWFGEDVWRATFAPTPGGSNETLDLKPCPEGQVRNEETNRCRTEPTLVESALEPCGPGRERNPETNRCRATSDPVSRLVPCGPGQERNPLTNRCRAIQPASRALVPCGPGQERNPETNRCRAIQPATKNLVPCGPGQERNPETNRCRAIVGDAGDVMGVQDIYVETTSDAVDWTMTAGVFLLASVYGAWEWRREFSRLSSKLVFWKRTTRS